MANKTYSEKLKSPKWQKKRLEILQRDNFTCQLCGDKETELHINHLKYTGEPHEAPNRDLETLCKVCHKLKHSEPDLKIIVANKLKDVFGNDVIVYKTDAENVRFANFDSELNFDYHSDYLLWNKKVLSQINEYTYTDWVIDFGDTELSYNDFGGYKRVKHEIEEFLGSAMSFFIGIDEDLELHLDRTSHSFAIEFFSVTRDDNKTVFTHCGGAS